MTDTLISSTVTVILAIIGVAILAVLVGRQSKTVDVIKAGTSGLSQLLGTAISPVGGNGLSIGGASFGGGGIQFTF